MVVAAMQAVGAHPRGPLQFFLGVGAHDKRLVHGLAEPLDGVGGAGAEDFRVRLQGQELGKRKIPLLKSQPADRLAQVAILHFVFGVARQFDRRRPAFFDAEFRQKGMSAWLQNPPQLRRGSGWGPD